MGLLLLYSAVVVHEDEGAVIFGVDVTLRTLVSRAEIALGVVSRQGCLGGTLLRSSAR